MSYADYIVDHINMQYEHGDPIFTEDLVSLLSCEYGLDADKSQAAVAVTMKRILDAGKIPELRRFQKGIYYRTEDSVFGEVGPDLGKIIDRKYIMPDKGYETGAGMFHRLGLTTQIPNMRYIASNVAHGRITYDKDLDISICPPKVRITHENKGYLRILDVINQMGSVPCDAKNPYDIIGNYIDQNGLQYEKLLSYANRYYNQKTVIRLGHIAGRKEYAFA